MIISQGIGSGQSGNDVAIFNRVFDVAADGLLKGSTGYDVLSLNLSAGSGIGIARGGGGDDIFSFSIERGVGRARLTGDAGADEFGLSSSFGRATVTDFDFEDGDRLDIPADGAIGPNGIVQEVGGTAENPFLLVSYEWRFQGEDRFTSYKLLGLDAPLSDAAFI